MHSCCFYTGGDFSGGPFQVSFPPSAANDQAIINITLVQDNIFEEMEGFFAVVTNNENLNAITDNLASEPLRNGVTLVNIQDADSKLTLPTTQYAYCSLHHTSGAWVRGGREGGNEWE